MTKEYILRRAEKF